MGDTLTTALIANTTSRIPFATGEWRGHLKNVGMYSRRIAYRDTCYMNKTGLYFEINFYIKIPYIFQEYVETCLFTQHDSLQANPFEHIPTLAKKLPTIR